MSLALVLGSPQSPALGHQAPGDGPFVGPPRVRVSPKEARRLELTAVGCVEWQAKMKTLGRGIVGPSVLACGFVDY